VVETFLARRAKQIATRNVNELCFRNLPTHASPRLCDGVTLGISESGCRFNWRSIGVASGNAFSECGYRTGRFADHQLGREFDVQRVNPVPVEQPDQQADRNAAHFLKRLTNRRQ
jgi:hypothetical protein